MAYSVTQLKSAAYGAGFRGPNLVIAVAVSLAENGARDPLATHKNSNGSTDYGAWQINSVHADLFNKYQWYTLDGNARMAYAVWKRQGWGAWTTYKSGAYKPNMERARKAKRLDPTGVVVQGSADTDNDTFGAVAGWAVDASAGPVIAAISWRNELGQLLSAVTSAEFWRRVGMGFAAFVLIIIAVIVMVASNKNVQKAAKGAASVAVTRKAS